DHSPSSSPEDILHDALTDVTIDGSTVRLGFDLTQVVDSLRYELYSDEGSSQGETLLARAYYSVRPLLSVAVRKHIQKWHFRGWDRLTFPQWPVDTTVENIFEQIMLLSLKAQSLDQIPFIWFWPEGASSCAIMTHDVETAKGVRICPYLMDMEDSFGFKASFQIVPEDRYEVTDDLLDSIRRRGFEV